MKFRSNTPAEFAKLDKFRRSKPDGYIYIFDKYNKDWIKLENSKFVTDIFIKDTLCNNLVKDTYFYTIKRPHRKINLTEI